MILFRRAILSAKLGKPGDRLWHVDDGEYRFYHWLQVGHVTGKDGIGGVQVVIGPLLISLAWRKDETRRQSR